MGQFLWSGVSARPWNVAADRPRAREIGAILTLFAAPWRQLKRNTLGGFRHCPLLTETYAFCYHVCDDARDVLVKLCQIVCLLECSHDG